MLSNSKLTLAMVLAIPCLALDSHAGDACETGCFEACPDKNDTYEICAGDTIRVCICEVSFRNAENKWTRLPVVAKGTTRNQTCQDWCDAFAAGVQGTGTKNARAFEVSSEVAPAANICGYASNLEINPDYCGKDACVEPEGPPVDLCRNGKTTIQKTPKPNSCCEVSKTRDCSCP